MADKRLTELTTELNEAPANGDLLHIVDVSDTTQHATGSSKKITFSNLVSNKADKGSITTSGLTQSTARLLGRTTASSGAIEEISAGTSLSLSAGSLNTIQDIRTTASPQFAGIELGNASDTTLSRSAAGVLAVEGVDVPTVSSTHTFTNKRITKRVTTITSSATPTINTDNCDCVTITAQAEAITNMSTNLSGTPTNFQTLVFRIKDNGTARAITWGTSFAAYGVALPTTTVINKVLTVGFIYDTVTSKWGCVASAQEA